MFTIFFGAHARRATLAGVLALVCLPWPVSAQDPLSLDEALRLAQARSLQLQSQSSAAAAARELSVAAGRLPDPVLTAGVNNLPVNGPDAFSLTADFMTMRSVGVMQQFTDSDKRRARSARFDRQAEAAESMRALALADLRRDTALAWLDRHYLERMIGLMRSQRDEARLQIEAAEAAYRGGRGAQADVFAARLAVGQIDERLRRLDVQAATAQTRLVRWVGPEGASALAPAPALRIDGGDAAATADALVQRHPRLAALAQQEALARAAADIARSEKSADWSVEVMYSQRGPSYSNMASLNVSIPLQWDSKNRQDRQHAASLSLADQARDQREEAQREVHAETLSWLQQWHSNRERLALYDDSLLPLAAERSRAALAAYRGGGAALAMVLDARRMEIELRLERLRLEMDSAQLWARIEFLAPPPTDAPNPPRMANANASENAR